VRTPARPARALLPQELWVVMFTGGHQDHASQQHKANLLRLGSDLAATPGAKVAVRRPLRPCRLPF
jgi:hypothetical protein